MHIITCGEISLLKSRARKSSVPCLARPSHVDGSAFYVITPTYRTEPDDQQMFVLIGTLLSQQQAQQPYMRADRPYKPHSLLFEALHLVATSVPLVFERRGGHQPISGCWAG